MLREEDIELLQGLATALEEAERVDGCLRMSDTLAQEIVQRLDELLGRYWRLVKKGA